MNKQNLLKQAIISHDVSTIRSFKNDDEVDFSIDLEEAISIGLSKNAHLNYFKMFFKVYLSPKPKKLKEGVDYDRFI